MRFADVLEIRNGRNQRQVECPNGKYPIYGSGGVMGYANSYICEANTVVIGRKGNINNPIFVEEPFWNVDTAFGLIPHADVLIPKYLFYFCENYNFEKLNTTVTIPSLTKANLLQVEIDVPEIGIQKSRVGILDKIEHSCRLLQQEVLRLDQLVKSRFVEMFIGKGYEEKSVRDVLDTAFWLMPATPKFVENGSIPYITSKNIKNRSIDFDNVKYITTEAYESISSNRPTQIGDILISMIGTLGQTAVIKDARRFYGQNLYLLRLNASVINTVFFCEFFNSDSAQHKLQAKRNQSTQAYLKSNHVEDPLLPLPPMEIQEQFAAFVAEVDKSKFRIQKSLLASRKLWTMAQIDAIMNMDFSTQRSL